MADHEPITVNRYSGRILSEFDVCVICDVPWPCPMSVINHGADELKSVKAALAAEQAAHAETRRRFDESETERLVQMGHVQYQRVLKEQAEKQRDLDRGRISAQAESLSIQAETIARLRSILQEIQATIDDFPMAVIGTFKHRVEAALATQPVEPPSEPDHG